MEVLSVLLAAYRQLGARRRAVCGVLVGLLAAVPVANAETAYRDDVVKAAFLFRFTGYVEWPEAAMESGQFTIGVLGSPGVAAELTRLLERYSVKNLPARVRTIDWPSQANDVQMLYVGADFQGNLRDVTQSLRTRPVLVVTDQPDGLEEGSAVNFLLVDRRVRFEVSLPAATKAGLHLSSQLLSVAARVRGAQSLRPFDACRPDDDAEASERRCTVRVALR